MTFIKDIAYNRLSIGSSIGTAQSKTCQASD